MITKTFFTPAAGNEGCRRLPVGIEVAPVAHGSNAKMRFQSFFMLMTIQRCGVMHLHLYSSTLANGLADHGRKRLRVNLVFSPGLTSTRT